MLPQRIIEAGTLVSQGHRVSITVRIPWYRALPLSSITDVAFAIDGVDVPRDSITWTVDGATYRLDDLPACHDEWWFVLDSAVIEGDLPEIRQADEHDVHVFIGLYIPYLPAGDQILKIGEQDRKRMPLIEEVAV